MALRNRTEAKAVIAAWAAILDLEATHKPDLIDKILDNCLFRKDVSDSQVASGATKTLDFDGFDYIEVAQSNNVAYTLNNIQQGEIKFLKITKTAAQTIGFVNATDVSIRKVFITTTTIVIYKITNKDGNLYVESININNERTLEPSVLDIGNWNMNTGAGGTLTINVPHGLSSGSKIKIAYATIVNDAGTVWTPLDIASVAGVVNGSITSLEVAGNISLRQISGSAFDNASYQTPPGGSRGSIGIFFIQ